MTTPNDEADDIDELFEEIGISRAWADGFFTTLAIGPDAVVPSTWMPELLEDFEFVDDAEAEWGNDMLREYAKDVARAIREDEAICPEPDDEEGCADFSEGMLAGSRLHPSWAQDEDAIALLLPFAVLSGALPDKDVELDPDSPIKDLDAWKKHQRESLEDHVAMLDEHFEITRAAAPAKADAKPGRNDVCPCGSGKKYKKCHGAPN
ncbi:MAG TPA: UPF0149 family protein [Polyangiaceae bacterium]